MNWDEIEGNWKQLKGKARSQWGKLTDDDLELISGKRTELVLWDQALDRRRLKFSGSDHDGWLVAPPGLCRAIGTLYPIAE